MDAPGRLMRMERQGAVLILTVLQENNGNQCRAARQLGMHRNTLSRTISELKIDMRQLRDGIRRPPRSARPAAYEKKAVR